MVEVVIRLVVMFLVFVFFIIDGMVMVFVLSLIVLLQVFILQVKVVVFVVELVMRLEFEQGLWNLIIGNCFNVSGVGLVYIVVDV